jgi:hypothetical protein
VPLAVVHHLYHPRLLVFYHRVVVPTVAYLLHRGTLVLDCFTVIVYMSTCYINMPYASGFVRLELTQDCSYKILLKDIIEQENKNIHRVNTWHANATQVPPAGGHVPPSNSERAISSIIRRRK